MENPVTGEMIPADAKNWEARLAETLQLFGHRNWIVVADAAYPAQSRPGIETVVADAGQLHVVRKVLEAIDRQSHIRAKVHLDRELAFIPEEHAPGISNYREELNILLADSTASRSPHESIIFRLDEAAQAFSILIIKTTMVLPYTSVFIELDCGYWNAEAEQALRNAILNAHSE